MSFFHISGLNAGYAGIQVLQNISFSMENGALTGLLGPNGCGKTTLIKVICGALPHSGDCTLDGQRLEKLSARHIARLCSYIPQRSGIAIDLSLLDVVLMGFNPYLSLLEQPGAAMKNRALEALRLVGLSECAYDSYQTLSEGQKQLCILARTLVSDGKLLLLDEPESALDFQRRYAVLKLIRKWISSGERCALVTLHDPQLALNCCDRLLMMLNGRIAASVRPAVDPLDAVEAALKTIYGPVTLLKCADRSGREQIVMLREGGEMP